MKLFKTDGRYKYYDEGFSYIAEFSTNYAERILFGKLRKQIAEKYGLVKQFSYMPDKVPYTESGKSTVWRCDYDIRRNTKRRIYVKDESVITFAMLMIG